MKNPELLRDLAANLVDASLRHCDNSGEDHLAGDMQDVMLELLKRMPPAELRDFVARLHSPSDDEDGTLPILANDYPPLREAARVVAGELNDA